MGDDGGCTETHVHAQRLGDELQTRSSQDGEIGATEEGEMGVEGASVSGKSSRGAVSSKSGNGVIIAEAGVICQVQVVDGVSATKVGDGLKWIDTSSCLRNATMGCQNDSGLDFHGSSDGSK